METYFARAARAFEFQRLQLELIIGSLLGDGTLLRTTAGYSFRAHHGLAQRALLDWKYAQLQRFVRTPPRQSGGGYYFRTITHPQLTRLRGAFYVGSCKIVPLELLEEFLTPYSLAVWIMDDGAIDGKQVRLNTQSFTEEEAYGLACMLERKFGVHVRVNHDKQRPRLRFAADRMHMLRNLVLPHMLPEMRYKLP